MKAFVTANLTPEALNELKILMEVVYEPWVKTGEIYFDAKELAQKLEGVDIFITETDDVKKKEFFELTNIKLLISCRGDPFNVNLKAATEKGLLVLNTPLRNVDAVADLTVCYILMLARKVQEIDRILHSEDFEVVDFEDWIGYFEKFRGTELGGKAVGIIGLGQIGRRVVDRLRPFGVNCLVYDPYIPDEIAKEYGEIVDIDFLVRNSDFITIHAAATDENDNLINGDRINSMKKTAFLINTAKGSLVDYEILEQALKEKKIAGAALDVFPLEPIDEDNEFLELSNTIVSPHIGGDTYEIIERQSKMLLDDIKLWLNNKTPNHIMNPEVLSGKRIIKSARITKLKKKIVELCKILLEEKHVIGSAGNVSARIKDNENEYVLITPSNVNYAEMKPEDILIIDMEGKVIEGERNPSVEKYMHLNVYKEREDVNAIIHAHSIYSTVLSALNLSLPPVMEELVPYIGGEVQCADYGEAGSEELAKSVINALKERNAVLLANHGNLCCGSHLEGAKTVLNYLERGAKIYYLAKLIKDPQLLPEDTVEYEMDIFDIFKESKKI
ncbi:MAG: class II aldolase/adducin family protein [Promethearchaeota archaeon]|nr:MAG: class II aldolase/adducin family protein [Candidatus Lokiarchaeota archaeon]